MTGVCEQQLGSHVQLRETRALHKVRGGKSMEYIDPELMSTLLEIDMEKKSMRQNKAASIPNYLKLPMSIEPETLMGRTQSDFQVEHYACSTERAPSKSMGWRSSKEKREQLFLDRRAALLKKNAFNAAKYPKDGRRARLLKVQTFPPLAQISDNMDSTSRGLAWADLGGLKGMIRYLSECALLVGTVWLCMCMCMQQTIPEQH